MPPETHVSASLAVPPGASVLLYGGTFDPPHRGHAELAVQARDALGSGVPGSGAVRAGAVRAGAPGAGPVQSCAMPAAWLVYVPAGRNPHKPTGPIATGADRVDMLRLATRGVPRVAIWTVEIDRADAGEATYWIDTLREARDTHAGPMRFLIGADQAVSFHLWRNFREILGITEPVVMPRDAVTDGDAFRDSMQKSGAWNDAELHAWDARLVRLPVVRAASSSFRSTGSSADIPPAVAAFIQRRGLYK
ncbi:MAG: nicotinate-nicotinamide nucleotide adenylyltransferase [Planctomycetota bacterium]